MKRNVAIFLVVLILLTVAPLVGFVGLEIAPKAKALDTTGQCGDDVFWNFNESTGALTISGSGEMYYYYYLYGSSISPFYEKTEIKFVTIDSSVTSISYAAFSGCTALTSVTIGDSVTSIGGSAFYNCSSLTSVTIPNSVTSIGDAAFSGCTALTSVTIGDSVMSIGGSAFYNCSMLTSVMIPNSVTYIGNSAFYYCSALERVTIGDSVTSIGYEAFYNCSSLTSVMIPNSVTSIGYSVFYNCSALTSVTIPDSVTSIGSSAFSGCTALTSVTIGNSVTSIVNSTFSRCIALESVTIPDSIKTIGNSAFYNCRALTSMTIPDSVTYIGDSAFSGCTALTSVTIPNSVMSIGDSAFSDCTALTSVTIGDSVTSIGDRAFYYCTTLESVTIGDSVTSIGGSAFYNCSMLTSVTIPNSVTSIGAFAFYNCTSLTSVMIGDSVTSIGHEAFYNCTSLTSVTIGDSVTSIGYEAFYNCSSLTSVTIPNSVTSIGEKVFCNCSSLTSVTIGNSLTSIGEEVFYNCSSLTSVTIPNSVTSIGYAAFSGCTALTSVTIGDSVMSIGGSAFYYCSALERVTIGNSVTSIGDRVFCNCSALTSVTIPDSVTSIGSSAFSGCTALTSVMIGNSVTSIVNSTFSRCIALESVTIPDRVTYIGDSAFSGCTALTSVTIPNSVTNIGSRAFESCSNIKKIYISDLGAWVSISGLSYLMQYGSSQKELYLNGALLSDAVISDGATIINDYAFRYCTSLTSVTIPDSVTSIGKSAFAYCDTLLSVTIPNSVTSIGDSAFYGCTALESVTIPDSVTNLGDYAFFGCTALENITIPDSVTSIGYYSFGNCSNLKKIYITDLGAWVSISGLSYLMRYGSSQKEFYLNGALLTVAVIPDGVTNIVDYVFYGCTALTSVTIPDSVTSIGKYAFAYCTALESVTIPDSVTSIDSSLFYNTAVYNNASNWVNNVLYIGNHLIKANTSIRGSYAIKSGTKCIADNAFYNCYNLTSVTIPDSVTSIGSYAFNKCYELTSVSIGTSVTSIGLYAFYNCSKLKDVYYNGIEDQWTSISIDLGNDALQNATIHFNSTGSSADENLTTIVGILESYLPQIDVENGGVWVMSVTIDGVTYPVQNRLIEDTLNCDIGKTVTVELTNGVVTELKVHVGEAATGTCKIRSTSDSKDIEVPFEYWDDDFLQSSYVYNHDLAKMSLRLALSAFNSTEGRNYDKNDKSRNVQDLLDKCGFQSVEASDSYGEKPSADSIGVCFGSKEIGNSTLIAVAIRGGGYEAEWAGNFEIGGDVTHHGFAIAATKVQSEILKYLEHHPELLSKKLKFWVVGYSRAGATANLVSAWLGSKPVDWQLEKKDIYAYTFEAPQPTTLAKNNRNYDYIHNIVNPVDLVPKVVMSSWGYARYGKNMWLPSVSTTVNFSSPVYAQAIQAQMDAYLSAGNYTDGHPMIPLNAAHAPVLDILMDELASNLQNPNSDRTKLLSYLLQQLKLYENHAQTDITKTDIYCYLYAVSIKHIVSSVIGKLVEGYSENKIIGSVAEKISDTVIQALTKNPDVTDGIGIMAAKMFLRVAELYSFKPRMLTMYDGIYTLTETGKVLANVGEIATCLMTPHFPELTLALLDSVDSLPEVCGYRAVKVNCPVDVYAYNENGDVVAQIIDEQSIEEENQMIYSYVDEDGQKIIFFPDDADFDIKVIARDSGIMNYSVSEYDCNTGKTTQLVNYNDIPVQKGAVFNGEVPTVEADTDTIYTFSSSTSDVDLTETVLKGDQIIEYTVTVNAEGEGYVSGNSIKKYGEFVLVNAVPDKNSIFTGWFKDGKLVSADAEYRFRVDGDVTLTAKFMPHTHIYSSNVTTEPTCTTDGETIYICTVCGDTYTEPIPTTGEHVDEDNDGYCDACEQQMTGGNHCKYCGKIHDGLFGWLVKFFHSILAIFKR